MKPATLTVAERLAAGPPRGLGCANEVAAEALDHPAGLRGLVEALRDRRSVVTIRAANALNKVQQARPELLVPHARALLQIADDCADLRTRWNLTTVIGALPLRGKDRALAMDLLFEALRSESGFLRAFALTGLVNFAAADGALQTRVAPLLQRALDDNSAATRARARKLIKLLADGRSST